jgi:hypothetical protein
MFGAVCPVRGAGAALVLHLDEIATKVTPGAHAVVVLDQAGWHKPQALKFPSNISLMPLPPRSPALNPQENIWQFRSSGGRGKGSPKWHGSCFNRAAFVDKPERLALQHVRSRWSD